MVCEEEENQFEWKVSVTHSGFSNPHFKKLYVTPLREVTRQKKNGGGICSVAMCFSAPRCILQHPRPPGRCKATLVFHGYPPKTTNYTTGFAV